MISNVMKAIAKDVKYSAYLEKFFNKKNSRLLSIVFGLISLILLTLNFLISISTLNLSTITAFIVSSLLSIFSIIPLVDITNLDTMSLDIIPFSDKYHIYLIGGLNFWNGVLLLSLSAYIIVKLVGLYIKSKRYSNISLFETGRPTEKSYLVKTIFINEKYGDLIFSFFNSSIGIEVTRRLGLTDELISNFLSERTDVIDYRNDQNLINIVSLEELATYISLDKSVAVLFRDNGIRVSDFINAVILIESIYAIIGSEERYFGRTALTRRLSLVDYIIFDTSLVLKSYLKKIEIPDNYRINTNLKIALSKIEEKISKNNNKGLLLVSDEEHIAYNLIVHFYKHAMYNYRAKNIKNKDLYYLDINALCIENRDKHSFEGIISSIFNELSHCRDIVLVIPSFYSILIHSRNIGVNFDELIKLFESKNIQIIAISDNNHFYKEIHENETLNKYFDHINVIDNDKNNIYSLIARDIKDAEDDNGVSFEMSSINKIILISKQSFVCGILLEKIKELITEISRYSRLHNIEVITDAVVEKYASYIPNMVVEKNDENNKINTIDIENELRKSIFGQDHVISSIVSCIKQNNSNFEFDSKPLSFILLGPDNHLKFEITKAVSKVVSNSDSVVEINLSDYADELALDRLIGANDKQVGIFSVISESNLSKILILNDFDKANSDVLDLFKNIFLNGFVYNYAGNKIDFNGVIIFALSSVGSNYVHINYHNGKTHDKKFELEVLDKIINSNHFRKDVLDAFSEKIILGVVNKDDYRKITQYLLNRLSLSFKKEDITLIVNDYLIDSVLHYGIDPSFGIYPIKKAINEVIEKRIREKIIAGKIEKGSVIEFREGEIL